jgi:hypothetical protein
MGIDANFEMLISLTDAAKRFPKPSPTMKSLRFAPPVGRPPASENCRGGKELRPLFCSGHRRIPTRVFLGFYLVHGINCQVPV